MADVTLTTLIERIRRGDSEAVRLFVDEYQGAVEREVRFALLDRRLRRIVSESDVKQSVIMRFVVDLWAG